MKQKKTIIDEYTEDPEFRKFLAREELILEFTEKVCELLEQNTITRQELANRIGKTEGQVSQMLGGRNLTINSVADMFHVLGYKVKIKVLKV